MRVHISLHGFMRTQHEAPRFVNTMGQAVYLNFHGVNIGGEGLDGWDCRTSNGRWVLGGDGSFASQFGAWILLVELSRLLWT
jgi:hypothetical protein